MQYNPWFLLICLPKVRLLGSRHCVLSQFLECSMHWVGALEMHVSAWTWVFVTVQDRCAATLPQARINCSWEKHEHVNRGLHSLCSKMSKKQDWTESGTQRAEAPESLWCHSSKSWGGEICPGSPVSTLVMEDTGHWGKTTWLSRRESAGDIKASRQEGDGASYLLSRP
jgi:hypothetical protein